MKISRFEELDCWQEARTLVRNVYEATEDKRFSRDLRPAGQIQSAATSSMANIAEGFIRKSNKEFIQFLYIAMSSSLKPEAIYTWLWIWAILIRETSNQYMIRQTKSDE